MQGFGAASVLSLGAGTVADITEPKRRASAISIVLLGPQLGPVLGPLLGGTITGGASWRWIFGFLGMDPPFCLWDDRIHIDKLFHSAITCFAVYVILLFCLPETLRSIVGNGSCYTNESWIIRLKFRQPRVADPTEFPRPPPPTLLGLIKLLRYAPITIVSVNNALLFAAFYGINVTLPRFLEEYYDFTSTEVGVAYLAPGKPDSSSPASSLFC